jgi:hypothetical protein
MLVLLVRAAVAAPLPGACSGAARGSPDYDIRVSLITGLDPPHAAARLPWMSCDTRWPSRLAISHTVLDDSGHLSSMS